MTGFEHVSSGAGSNLLVNCAIKPAKACLKTSVRSFNAF